MPMTEQSHKSRTARTCDVLRDAIVHAEFAPGEKLRIDHLGRVYEASIGAVREALSRLTAEGLVVAMPQKGFIVAPISRKELIDLTEVRIEIECKCLARSIEHGDLEWEGRVASLQHKLRALHGAWDKQGTPEGAQWHQVHEAFHAELAAACDNLWWLRLRNQLYVQSERYRRLSRPWKGEARDVTAEHDAIANATLARDARAAQAAMREHLQGTADILLASPIPFADAPGDRADGDTDNAIARSA